MSRRSREQCFQGAGISPGIAIGVAVAIDRKTPEVLRFQLRKEDVRGEQKRFRTAREAAVRELVGAQGRMRDLLGDELAQIFEAQASLLADPSFESRVEAEIEEREVNAEWAVVEVCSRLEEQFASIENEYLRERGEDLRNVSRYLLQSLQGVAHHEISSFEGDVIMVGTELTPAEALRFARQGVAGFALEAGGATSHTAIIARGLRIPTVVGIRGVVEAATDLDPMIVDGTAGKLILHPDAEHMERYLEERSALERQDEALARTSALLAETSDGEAVQLMANLELPEEIADAKRFGCHGIGLYRSEFFYIERGPDLPTEEEHVELFTLLLTKMAPAPVVVRTFDLGGNKVGELMAEQREENPVLGLRGIRLTLARPKVFRSQLRGLFRAGIVGNLRIMVPLVTTIDEIREFRSLCEEVVAELAAEGLPHASTLPLGAMIETPGAAIAAEHFAREVDFLSIGTNDLIQYTLAVDRGNELVAHLYQPFHPAVLRLLRLIVGQAERGGGCEISICGEMAADPRLTPYLLGIGLRQFSMAPRSLPVIKERLRSLSTRDLPALVDKVLTFPTAREVEAYLDDELAGKGH